MIFVIYHNFGLDFWVGWFWTWFLTLTCVHTNRCIVSSGSSPHDRIGSSLGECDDLRSLLSLWCFNCWLIHLLNGYKLSNKESVEVFWDLVLTYISSRVIPCRHFFYVLDIMDVGLTREGLYGSLDDFMSFCYFSHRWNSIVLDRILECFFGSQLMLFTSFMYFMIL